MLAVSEHITTTLSHAAITALVTGGVFWELAEQDNEYPFVTFSFEGEKTATKEAFRTWVVSVRIFAKSLTEGAEIVEAVNTARNEAGWRDRGIRSGYTDAEAKEAFVEIKYEFKK